jgi:hypothetical protein
MSRAALSTGIFGMLAACALLIATGCDGKPEVSAKPQAAQKPAVVVSQVRTDRIAIDPAKGETVSIRFNLSEKADVALSIFDGRDHLVYRHEEVALVAGDHAIAWNAHDRAGATVPAEAYTYTLTASNARGRSVHDLTDLTGGQRIEVKDVQWDADAGAVRYYLDKSARVNLRLGLDSGPYLRTVVDWVPRQTGAHAETWDGMDASGVMDLAKNPALKPAVTAYSLPDNTIFVGAAPDRIQFVAERAKPLLRERTTALPAKQIANSAQQPLETRGDVEAFLTLVGDFKRDADGRWRVRGRVPFRADVAKADRQRVIQRRFEAAFYVDGIFTYENELGYLPMTWNWDASALNPGEHFVTLNIRGYEGNFGTATVKVLVEPASSDTTSQATDPAEGK